MNDETRWDQDPPHDERLARLLRAGNADAPYFAVDWEHLCRMVMRSAGSSSRARLVGVRGAMGTRGSGGEHRGHDPEWVPPLAGYLYFSRN